MEREDLRTLTIAQLAEESGIKKARLRKLVRTGKGPKHFRINREYRFRYQDVKEWLAKQVVARASDL